MSTKTSCASVTSITEWRGNVAEHAENGGKLEWSGEGTFQKMLDQGHSVEREAAEGEWSR